MYKKSVEKKRILKQSLNEARNSKEQCIKWNDIELKLD